MIELDRGELFILLQGVRKEIASSEVIGRHGTMCPSTVVIYLRCGLRILPAHFKYGLVKTEQSWFSFQLKLSYPRRLMIQALRAPSIFSKIKKDDTWQGGPILVPFKLQRIL